MLRVLSYVLYVLLLKLTVCMKNRRCEGEGATSALAGDACQFKGCVFSSIGRALACRNRGMSYAPRTTGLLLNFTGSSRLFLAGSRVTRVYN